MSKKERLTKCPLCKSGLFLNHTQLKDHSISKEVFLVCQCSNCQLLFTNPRPKESEIQYYYESEDYISHKNQSNNLTNTLYKQVRKITLKKKLELVNAQHSEKRRILDIGAGTGHFLETASKGGWKTYGIEPNQEARIILKEKGIKTYNDLQEIKKGKKFTVITLFHVLEHIHELRKTAKKIYKLLEDSGTLIIAVPNKDSFDAAHYNEYWAAWDVPRHLYHFNKESITYFAEEFDFKIVDTVPMYFDSYYVSILSEKYINTSKSPLKNLLTGVYNGLKSNHWAKKNGNNYSSLLFILKKK